MIGRVPTIFGVDNIEDLEKKVKLGILDIHLTAKGKATHRLVFIEGRLKKEEISSTGRTKTNPITTQL